MMASGRELVSARRSCRNDGARQQMTPAQSNKLKIGQRVAWQGNVTDQGVITACDWSGVQIEWDDGEEQFFHHNNMGEVDVSKSNF